MPRFPRKTDLPQEETNEEALYSPSYTFKEFDKSQLEFSAFTFSDCSSIATNPDAVDVESQASNHNAEPPTPLAVKVLKSQRRGLLSRFAILAEVEEPKHYSRHSKWFITFVVASAAAAAPMGSAIFYRKKGHYDDWLLFANNTPRSVSSGGLRRFSYSADNRQSIYRNVYALHGYLSSVVVVILRNSRAPNGLHRVILPLFIMEHTIGAFYQHNHASNNADA